MIRRQVWLSATLVVSLSGVGLAQRTAPGVKGAAAPAPRRDLTGAWMGVAVPKKEPVPAMTAWGQAFFDRVKPLWGPRAVPIAQTTDPLATCDPLGFPRNVLYETRGFAFEHLAKRTIQLMQYQKVWREIWTDGRALPGNVGAEGADTRDPRYYGYSVGQWADDFTFVVTTTGFDEDAWADELGHPRSMHARVEERYRRVDHDTLELTVSIDDPKAYVKPFVAMTQVFRWNPLGEFEEQLCIPSQALDYRATFTPAGVAPK